MLDTLKPEIEALSAWSSHTKSTISVCAQTIANQGSEYIGAAGLDITKMRGIGTDGASNYDWVS